MSAKGSAVILTSARVAPVGEDAVQIDLHATALGVQRHVPSAEICPGADFFAAAYDQGRGGRALVDRDVGGDDLDVRVAQNGVEEAWLGPTGAEVKLTRGQERYLFGAPAERLQLDLETFGVEVALLVGDIDAGSAAMPIMPTRTRTGGTSGGWTPLFAGGVAGAPRRWRAVPSPAATMAPRPSGPRPERHRRRGGNSALAAGRSQRASGVGLTGSALATYLASARDRHGVGGPSAARGAG